MIYILLSAADQVSQLEEELNQVQEENIKNDGITKLSIIFQESEENELSQHNGTVDSNESSNHETALQTEISKLNGELCLFLNVLFFNQWI